MTKHKWNYAEDFNCCVFYLWSVFMNVGDDRLTALVDILAEDIRHIDRGSLRMKLQNIKAIALDAGLEDRFTFTPLNRYSKQCAEAFDRATDCLSPIMDALAAQPEMTIEWDELREFAWMEMQKTKLAIPEGEIVVSDDTDAFSNYKMISKEEREALLKKRGERKIKNVR